MCWSLLLLFYPHGVVVVFLRCCRLRILFFVLLLRCRCRLLLRCYGRVWLLRCYGCVLLLPSDVTFSLPVVLVWIGFCFKVFVSLLVFLLSDVLCCWCDIVLCLMLLCVGFLCW